MLGQREFSGLKKHTFDGLFSFLLRNLFQLYSMSELPTKCLMRDTDVVQNQTELVGTLRQGLINSKMKINLLNKVDHH